MLVRRRFVSCSDAKCKADKWMHCGHTEVPTAAVIFQSPPILVINENFFMSLGSVNPEEDKDLPMQLRLGVLEHEILHMVMRHDGTRFPPEQYASDSNLLNIAMDLTINQLIQPEKLLPVYQTIDKYDLPKDKTTEFYFAELKKLREKALKKYENLFKNGGVGKGGCCSPGKLPEGLNAKDWNVEMDLALQSIIKEAYENALKHPKGIGSLPGSVNELVKKLFEKPKVPWFKELRQFPASLGRSRLSTSIKRESKRYGTVPGNKIKGNARVLVCIDTSGSVSGEELSIFANEISHLHKNGAEVFVMCVDTVVHSVKQYQGKLPSVQGRGGTDLKVIWTWIRDHKFITDAIVVQSDGHTDMYPEPPSPIKTLWVLHNGKNSALAKIKWGKVIHID